MPTPETKRSIKLVRNVSNEFGSFSLASGGSFPIQFLPWMTHSMVGMTMDGAPDFFFTAAINGCSVFVTGDPAAPQVFHGGIGTDLDAGAYTGEKGKEKDSAEKAIVAAAAKKDAPLFFRLFLEKVVPGATKDKNFAEVNKTMYVNDGSKSTIDGGKSTKRANAFEKQFVEKNKDGAIVAKTMMPWGCVFGIKSGTWKFYLQENMTIFYSEKNLAKPHAVSVPIAVTQFYPKGQEKTNLVKTPPTLITNPYTPSDLIYAGWMPATSGKTFDIK